MSMANLNGHSWSRRGFLKLLSLSMAAIPFRSVPVFAQGEKQRFFSRQKADRSKRVIVIGAGLAGLTAAYELSQAGHDVTVLEARNRAGGRVFTVREFADGLYAECGGEWVEHNHEYVMHYIEEFGLSLFRSSYIESEMENLQLSPGARIVDERMRNLARDVALVDGQDAARKDFDQLSFSDLLRKLDAPPDLMEQMERAVSGLMAINMESISAMHMFSELSLPKSIASYRIAGGNDQIPRAISQRLRDRIYYSRPVLKISQDASGVTVTFLENGSNQTLKGDRLIIAAPFTCVRKIEFDPPLSDEKMKIISTLGYGQVLKVPMQFRERFWLKESTDLRKYMRGLIGSLYDASGGQAGSRGLLTAYIPDKSGIEIAANPADKRIDTIFERVSEIYPSARQYFEGGYVKWWGEDPWAGGVYAYFRPGEVTTLRPIIAKPEKNIHFAGEHTAYWQGYMNGAIESGHRAAIEIQEEVPLTAFGRAA